MRVDPQTSPTSLSRASETFTRALNQASQVTGGDSSESSPTPGNDDYEDLLNSLASHLAEGINTDKRTVTPLKGDAATQFQSLVAAELQAQRERGETPDLETAVEDARTALFDRIGNALSNSGRDADDGLDVFEGYWNRHGGSDAAVNAAYHAYDDFLADTTLIDNPSYEDNLNALASALAGGTLTDSRNILHLDSSETLSQLYRNLIENKLDEGLDVEQAREQVNEDLRNRLDGAAGDDVVDIFDGYWSRHGGEEDAMDLADETWLANRDDSDIAYDNTLNSLVDDMANGIDIDNRTVTPLTGEAGEKFSQLVEYELNQQRERGEQPDLQSAIDDAEEALFGRLGNGLANVGKESDAGIDVFEGYWNRHGGEEAAVNAGYNAYNDFLADTTLLNNPSYEDNLNALASAMAGSTLTESRNILHLDSSDTLSQLYQNLINIKKNEGLSPSEAVTQVNDDLRSRLGNAAGEDGDAVVDIFDGYWTRHGGEDDAQRLTDHSDLDTVRREHDLPPASELDIQSMETSEVDPDNDSRNLTVSELTWQTLIDDWKKGIEDGSISHDDQRAQFYRALRAQGALDNGLDMTVLDISKGQNLAHATGDDLSAIIDGNTLDERLGELFVSDSVQKDYQEAQASAIDKVANKDEIAASLEDMAFSEEYVSYIKELRASGQSELAEADISRTYSSLAALFPATEDSDKAAEFAQGLQLDASIIDLDHLIENPDQINDANTATATQDVVKMVLTALKRAGVDIPRRTVETIDKFVNEYLNDKQTAKNFGKALQQLGDTFQKNGEITRTDIDNLLKKDVYKALNEKTNGGMLSLISTLNSNGALGSTGGLISLASGIYQLAGKGGTLADTPEERVAIAKEMIAFLGASQHFVSLGSNIADTVKGTRVNAMLGLDKSLPEIWGDDKSSGTPFTEEKGLQFVQNLEQIIDDAPVGDRERLSQKLGLSEEDTRKIVEGIENGYADRPGLPKATTTTRTISSFLRILDAGANITTGVMDTVLGGLMIKRGADSGDGATIAQGSITVAAGAFGLAGGGSAMAALRGISFARAATGPLFWVSAGLTLATLPFTIVQDIKYNNALDAHRDDLNDLFASLDEDGLLQEDGLERYTFLDAYMYSYGQRDAPEDKSIFDYRDKEYEFYTQEGHLPDPIWDGAENEHEDYAGDGSNLDTQMDKGSTVGA
ncbi:hypothetical protein [Halomonas huangheensis]|uniref:Uncharacterized protein n=1 Tax=Halomonas huangheensis TaxID=1178482 RepID=W1NBV5_9GAMM|nr:hypothetical protein [Halomonas huangheensis]ALM53027.1 hypothetical protein AR456_12565 [Halomonas huangheensis]ERL53042.1 hypothetical protein BJB45_17345 [Halomonas huangheensis]